MLVARRVAAAAPVVAAPDQKFAVLRRPTRVWAVAAIHGEAGRLATLHAKLEQLFVEGDRLVYLGNYLGHGAAIASAVDEILRLRRTLIARPRMFVSDVVYLRGSQEEMWEKLLQLQFAVNPREVLDWMVAQGVDATIRAYGGDPERGRVAVREGAVAISRWSGALRQAMADHPGHRTLMSALRRAAYTDDHRLLFVHAGIDPARPLAAQGDELWWGHAGWTRLAGPYDGFTRVVRGFDRGAARARPPGGVASGPFTLTVDGGCGFGGPLVAVCLTRDGEVVDRIDV